MPILTELYWLLILSFVVACVAWTVTQETIFEEWREAAKKRSEKSANVLVRKFFYVWTCEYCFSHWVTIVDLFITGFHLLLDDWRGYLIAFFTLPWLANILMSLYRSIRVEIKHENALAEQTIEENKELHQ